MAVPSNFTFGRLSCATVPASHPGGAPPSRGSPGVPLPKRNYGYEKRQKELEKKRKKEEKLQRRLDRTLSTSGEAAVEPPVPGEFQPEE